MSFDSLSRPLTPTASPSFRIGVALALVAALGFATKGILIKWAYASGVPSESLLSIRMLFASAILLAVRLVRKKDSDENRERLSPGNVVHLVALGFSGYYLSSYLDFKGLELLPASIERLILLLYPTFTVVLTAVLLRKPQPGLVWLALPICYLGLFFVLGNPTALDSASRIGVLFVFGSTVSYALYLVYSPSLIQKMGSMRFAEDVIFISSAMVIVHTFAFRGGAWFQHLPHSAWAYGFLLGLLSTVIPMYALSAAISRIGSPRASLLGMAGPLFTIALAALLLGERLSAVQILGALVILFGVYLAGKKTSPKTAEK